MSVPPISDLRGLDAADVWKGERLAGTLRRESDDVVFRYRSTYAAQHPRQAVAWTLPVTSAPTSAGAGSVPPFFAGLLPEGARLRAIVAGTRTSLDDQLTLLLAVGQDAIGDVRVLPTGAAPSEVPAALDEARAGEVDLRAVFAEAVDPVAAGFDPVALPGVQDKVSAAMASTPIRTGSGPAILKLNPEGTPLLVENEHFFLDLAEECGLRVPERRLLRDRHGRRGLLVARFDRHEGARLPQEDGCQVLGVYPAAKYRVAMGALATALADAVRDGGGSRPLALRHVLEIVAFSYLIGNGDLHAKNLSVRGTPDGLWEVTPAYDLVCTQPYLGWRDPMALDLYGRANRLDRRHLLAAAERWGLPQRAATSALDRICDAAPAGIARLGAIGFDERSTHRLGRLLTVRLAELRGDAVSRPAP